MFGITFLTRYSCLIPATVELFKIIFPLLGILDSCDKINNLSPPNILYVVDWEEYSYSFSFSVLTVACCPVLSLKKTSPKPFLPSFLFPFLFNLFIEIILCLFNIFIVEIYFAVTNKSASNIPFKIQLFYIFI